MNIDVKALAEQRFKQKVIVRVPTEKVDSKGSTVYETLEFLGVFKAIPVDRSKTRLAEIQRLEEDNDKEGLLELTQSQPKEFFIGFEALPGKDLPFTDGGEPLASTPENIDALLNVSVVREAVQQAWLDARNKGTIRKNSRP